MARSLRTLFPVFFCFAYLTAWFGNLFDRDQVARNSYQAEFLVSLPALWWRDPLGHICPGFWLQLSRGELTLLGLVLLRAATCQDAHDKKPNMYEYVIICPILILVAPVNMWNSCYQTSVYDGSGWFPMIQVSVQNLADLWQSLIPFAPLNLVEVAHVTH